MADNSYFQSPSVDYSQFYSGTMAPPVSSGGMLSQSQLAAPSIAGNKPTPAQLAAMKAIPAGSYQTPPNPPVMAPNIPAGSQYQNTGNLGRATPEMQQLIQLAGSGGIQPGWTIPQVPAALNVPLPKPRPGYAPTSIDIAAMNQQSGANPGMGGAMIGNGQMAPGIPPQGPPPPGIAPTVWGGNPPQLPQSGGYTAPGAPRPLTAEERYNLANQFGQQAALDRQGGATGIAGGYQYVNGQKVGYAPQTIGGTTYSPTNPATAYGLANAAGQIAALNKQATATGQTGVYNYVNGVKTGTVNGMSGAKAYAAANSGPGSVAAMEAWQGGGGGSPQSYGGGGSGDSQSIWSRL